jgi:hypothetical protein
MPEAILDFPECVGTVGCEPELRIKNDNVERLVIFRQPFRIRQMQFFSLDADPGKRVDERAETPLAVDNESSHPSLNADAYTRHTDSTANI